MTDVRYGQVDIRYGAYAPIIAASKSGATVGGIKTTRHGTHLLIDRRELSSLSAAAAYGAIDD